MFDYFTLQSVLRQISFFVEVWIFLGGQEAVILPVTIPQQPPDTKTHPASITCPVPSSLPPPLVHR